MSIENKVTSLSLSQALDKAGVKVPSERVWVYHPGNDKWYVDYAKDNPDYMRVVKAYDTDELLEVLPKTIPQDNWGTIYWGGLEVKRCGDSWSVNYVFGSDAVSYWYAGHAGICDYSLTNCLAKLLLKLIEEKLVEV